MKKGFTLVELLVVIAIIAIMAAILFPVFSTCREKARQATCISNLKQLQVAFTAYAVDHDQMFPPNNPARTPGTNWVGYDNPLPGKWVADPNPTTGSIWPYVRSEGVFRCPSDFSGLRVSYGANGRCPKISWTEFPAETCLLRDLDGWEKAFSATWLERHGAGYLAVFVDGHAKWEVGSAHNENNDNYYCGGMPD